MLNTKQVVTTVKLIATLAGLKPGLVIEYVSREDDKAKKLLRNKEDRYWDSTREYLEGQLARYSPSSSRLNDALGHAGPITAGEPHETATGA